MKLLPQPPRALDYGRAPPGRASFRSGLSLCNWRSDRNKLQLSLTPGRGTTPLCSGLVPTALDTWAEGGFAQRTGDRQGGGPREGLRARSWLQPLCQNRGDLCPCPERAQRPASLHSGGKSRGSLCCPTGRSARSASGQGTSLSLPGTRGKLQLHRAGGAHSMA